MLKEAWFYIRLVRSMFAWRRPRASAFMAAGVLAVVLPLSGFYAASVVTAASSSGAQTLDGMVARAAEAERIFGAVAAHFEGEVEPIERVLLTYRPNDPELVRRVATTLVGEGRRSGVDARVLLAVLLVENPMLDVKARSSAGATGLMQVMPMHRGRWEPCGADLTSIEDNICYGARIFASYLKRHRGDVERALLAYNGCVRSEGCQVYASHVYARAGRASILASLRK